MKDLSAYSLFPPAYSLFAHAESVTTALPTGEFVVLYILGPGLCLLFMLFAGALREAAQAYVAYRLGDDTAYRLGKVSLNPFKHIDWLSAGVSFFFLAFVSSTAVFPCPLPIPIQPQKFKHPKRSMLWVTLSGLTTTLLMILVFGGLSLLIPPAIEKEMSLLNVTMLLIPFNLFLHCAFLGNYLSPLFPLGIGRFICCLLPRPWNKYYHYFMYGWWILVSLCFPLAVAAGIRKLSFFAIPPLQILLISPCLRLWRQWSSRHKQLGFE